jgi:hypothetical protein
MQVRHALATAGKIVLGCLLMLAFAAVAIMGANVGLSRSAGSLRSAAPAVVLPSPPEDSVSDAASAATPVEVLAARFPSDDDVSQPPTFSAASMVPAARGETFDLGAVSGMAMVEPTWPAADGAAPAAGAEQPEPAGKSEPPKGLAAVAPPHRSSARAPNVVNDAMIASIKRRVKLTAEQEKLWPPVEAALRKIVYTRAAMNQQRGPSAGPIANIDPSSPEVQELKLAALPLLMRLKDDQKREVKELVHMMGLEAVASQF